MLNSFFLEEMETAKEKSQRNNKGEKSGMVDAENTGNWKMLRREP